MVLQPQILLHLTGILLTALLFYLLIPGIGAFYIRSSWRRFRRLLTESATYPSLDYRELRRVERSARSEPSLYRMFGHLQAMQGDNTIWISNGKVSVCADLEHVPVHVLSSQSSWFESGFREYPLQPPRKVLWEKISSLPEYTSIFLSGMVEWDQNHGVYRSSAAQPLLVIIYEGDAHDMLLKAAWSGRQKNEYWNPFTPGSLVLGSFSLFIYFYILQGYPQQLLPALIAISLSVVPLVPLLPPAVLFYYYYRGLWKQGRVLRAQRDLIRLPLIHFDEDSSNLRQSTVLKTGERYLMRHFTNLEQLKAAVDTASAHFIQPALPERFVGNEYYLFSNDQLQRPNDPMAEFIIVPGSPFQLVAECEKRAVKYELLGLSILGLGVGVTELLVFFFFTYVLV
ncbi:MAG: hypothetical protein ACOC2R_04655 [Spirochaetota bacterium]